MIVVDAGVIVAALADDGADGERIRHTIRGRRAFAPELLDLEVLSVLRRLTAAGAMSLRRATAAAHDLAELRIARISHRAVAGRCWELRSNLTPYDAAYVAVAELFDAPLLTADRRLAGAPGLRCRVELVDLS